MDYLLIAAIIPVIALGYYIYKKDFNKEPIGVLMKLFVLGFFAAIPVLIVELLASKFISTDDVGNFFILFINTFLSIALVEEFFKWLVSYYLGYKSQDFDEIYDIIVYSVFASLGFACIENILYVYSMGLGTAIMRALLSIPGHTCFGVIMGYYLARMKIYSIQKNDAMKNKNFVLSLIVPSLAHTLYDSFLFESTGGNMHGLLFLSFFFVFYLIMVVVCFRTVNKISSVQQKLYETGTIPLDFSSIRSSSSQESSEPILVPENTMEYHFCTSCGHEISGYNYCPYCGKHLK